MSELKEEPVMVGGQSQGGDAAATEQRVQALEVAVSTLAQMYTQLMESYKAMILELRAHRGSIEYLLANKSTVIH